MNYLKFGLAVIVGYIITSILDERIGWASKRDVQFPPGPLNRPLAPRDTGDRIVTFPNDSGTHGFPPRDILPFEPGRPKVP